MKSSSIFLKFLFFITVMLYTASAIAETNLEKIKNDYRSLLNKKNILLPHNGNFLIPFSYNFNPDSQSYSKITNTPEFQGRGPYNRRLEAEFQFSFIILTNRNVFDSGFNLFVGYTHHSWWQVYNSKWSRQFRESNYSPEVFARKVFEEPLDMMGGKLIAYDVGYIHQSNGQIQELTRSWNRIYLRFALAYGNTFIKTSLWYRVPENSNKDENSDIYKYLGYGELSVDQVWSKNRLQLKIIPGTKHQGVELSFSYPLNEGLRYFIKAGYGYGLSLIDYRNESKVVGVGFVLSDLLSQ